MKKRFLLLTVLVISLICMLAISASAEQITVVDNGSAEITLGACVIEELDKEIPAPSTGLTYVLNTETKTATLTAWSNVPDATLGKTLCLPSTVTYAENTYTVTNFSKLIYGTDDGNGLTNKGNYILISVYIPDTVLSIPASAFDSCRALEYVYVGKNVEAIGSKAFQYAGFTGEAYYIDNGSGSKVRSETLGIHVGNIKEFIWTTNKIKTLTSHCFHHMDFDENAKIVFAWDEVKTFESNCMSSNGFAFQPDHYNNGGFNFDEFDIRNATSIAADAFSNIKTSASVFKLRADQVKSLSPGQLRGGGSNQPQIENYFYIYGGDTADQAITFNGAIWTINAYYWGAVVHYNIYIKGYVNAFDGIDGLENQNSAGKDFIDYYFESKDALNHYFESIANTTEKDTTYTRYAKNTKGYFSACEFSDGHSLKAYNVVYADGVASLSEATTIISPITYSNGIQEPSCVLDGGEQFNCSVCDKTVRVESDGRLALGHDHKTLVDIVYENGFGADGYKSIKCTRCDDCDTSTKVDALFVHVGYSYNTKGSLVGIATEFVINNTALKEYETFKGDGYKVNFGVFIVNPSHLTSATAFFNGKQINTSTGVVKFEMDDSDVEYARLTCFMHGFDLNDTRYTSLELAVAGYTYETGDTGVKFIQKAYEYDAKDATKTTPYVSKVTKDDTILSTITIGSVKDPALLTEDPLPEYVAP
ncbi:MAG: leucine-rich repeat protein [Clostridia bacterium]|nr:leucine-rich repeat protein [Clostridia bacterium]